MPTIIGIDPGSRATGFGLIERVGQQLSYISSGDIRTHGHDFFARLEEIHSGIEVVLSEYRADICAVEGVFIAKNASSALKLGQARGVALAAVLAREIPIVEHAPRLVKKTVVGTGSATKEQVKYMVQKHLRIEGDLSSDAADALAIAICHALITPWTATKPNKSSPADFLVS